MWTEKEGKSDKKLYIRYYNIIILYRIMLNRYYAGRLLHLMVTYRKNNNCIGWI